MTTPGRARWLVRLAILLLPAGCASLETPSVTLSNLRVADVTLFEQRLLATLRVQNPNSVDLDIEGVSFDLEVNDQPFAKGVGKGNVVVPAYGTGVIEAETIASLSGFVRQLRAFMQSDGPRLSYRLHGKLKVRERAFAIPFEMRGDDLLKFRRSEPARDRRDE
jgi:LEA14-like dessication related protein